MIKRPYVNLKKHNIVNDLREALDKSMSKFTSLNGIVGIILDGGLSREYGDHLSEIDIIIYLKRDQFLEYKETMYPFALGITKIDGYLYDIKVLNFEEEECKEYDSIALWDLSYAIILYDPNGIVESFKNKKLSKTIELSSAGGLMFDSYWHYKLAGDIWIHREDILQGHFVLNKAIAPLISAIFIANYEYIPHDKWIVHMSKSLSWKPNDWDKMLVGAMGTGDFSLDSVKIRQKYIDTIWNEVNEKLCNLSGFNNGLSFVQKPIYESFKKLIEKCVYTIDEWKEITSLESLNYEPIHSVFKIIDNKVILDVEKLLMLKPEDMYVWFYEIVDKARD